MTTLQSRAYTSLAHIAIVMIAVMMSLQVHQWGCVQREAALADYRQARDEETRQVAARIEHVFDGVRRGIAMIAALPSVRNPLRGDRVVGGFGGDAGYVVDYAIERILRPAAVARLYIASLDPGAGPVAIRAFPVGGRRAGSVDEPEVLPVAGDDESRLIEAQIDRLRRSTRIDGGRTPAEMPMVSGPEVKIAEASSTTRGDREARAIVFSVPVVASDGVVVGAVSAAVRSSELRRLLPRADHALVDVDLGTVIASPNGIVDTAAMTAAVPVPDQPFSTVRRVVTGDDRSWRLWVTRPASDFYYGADHLTAALAEVACLVLVWVAAGAAMVVVSSQRRRQSRLDADAELLARRIEALLRPGRTGSH